ncbi:hypothetical protein TUN199_08807 [Pyrenophora tritici-repentis]|uniref:Uncharacterized protein n=1 Tax=Pyrenophora tritici-repentis (strain Pt-1C-BFP) TaxID=426418 RepID=B2WGQ3_PYRTR|nr:uncharacterized protein PTRG_09109 [Pyrenophora tritici-repentis Pt-1C-BFP]KAF7442270.1 hypothetical protein A1F99_131390 [Pyrenophora tritici-repentis]EDU42160.1 predicted protein [Pyrenophora tritici-repentis Pt-1C-BFP]KAI0588848.1 hypothetical protein Alg130_03225 [Pyrenophora tritici-repentis]KAI0612967.1 hypothetical protein TUN205_02810 [Pyrenophora tritici-repentis]KAI0619196.1 hypothetical protein TUN199_08807 [Pyrenophora tritici-repentis]
MKTLVLLSLAATILATALPVPDTPLENLAQQQPKGGLSKEPGYSGGQHTGWPGGHPCQHAEQCATGNCCNNAIEGSVRKCIEKYATGCPPV